MATRQAETSSQERQTILSQISDAQRQKEYGEATRRSAQDIIIQFQGQQEEDLTPEEVAILRQARADDTNSNVLIRLMDENLRKLRAALKRYDTVHNTMPIARPSKTVTHSVRSATSSVRARSKQLELGTEEALINLEEKFGQERVKIQDQIEDLENLLTRVTEDTEKKKLTDEIDELRIKLKRCERDLATSVAAVKKREQLEKKKILAELEEVDGLDSGSEHGGNDHVKDWLMKQNKLPTDTAAEAYCTPRGSVVENQQNLPLVQPGSTHRSPNLQPPETRRRIGPAIAADPVADLTNALKDAFREVRGDREWEPKDLPTFYGKAEDWPIFSSEFWRTTPRGKVNSSQNAIRLRKALRGSALESVVGLINEPNNVNRILQILEERFGRKELVIRALISKVEQSKSPDVAKPDSFVTFGTLVQHLVETVKSLKEERYLNDMTLMDKLVMKLPTLYAAEWIGWIRARQSYLPNNLEAFGQWVDEKISVLVCLTTPIIKEENSVLPRNSRTTRGSAKVNAAVTEDPAPASSTRNERGKCACCEKGNHKTDKCWSLKKRSLDERYKLVKDKGLCFRCLGGDHRKNECQSDIVCDQPGCNRDHHPLLHFESKRSKEPKKKEENGRSSPPPQEIAEKQGVSSASDVASNIGVVQSAQSRPLSIVKVRIKGPKGTRRVYAMLDNGSDTTLIDATLAQELGLDGKQVRHKCQVFGGGVTSALLKLVNFEIAGCFKTAKFYPIQEAVAKENWILAPYSQDVDTAKKKWPYMRKAKLDSFNGVIPRIMIGEDYPALAVHREVLEGKYDQPIAKRTHLGWVMGGRKLRPGTGISHVNAVNFHEDEQLDKLIKHYFSLESYGAYPKNVLGSVEDKKAAEMMEQTIRKAGNRWECALLWRDPGVILEESRTEAVKRLLSNERRIAKDPQAFQLYHEKMDEYLSKGYMKELTPVEASVRNKRTLYIPHFAVFNAHKPGKIRIVFDATCARGGESLNKHLYTGPDLIHSLTAVMLNFRRFNVAINGDIEEMYHRVMVQVSDRDSQRFVWRDLRHNAKNKSIRDFWMNVLLFGASCSQAIAIYAKDKNAEEFSQTFPEAVRAIKEDCYSDDCLSGAQTAEDAIKLLKQITQICAAGDFHIKKWLSNSKKVIDAIPEEDPAAGLKGFNSKEEIPPERVLGVLWNPETDEFTFSTNFKKVDPEILKGRRPTKREMCSLWDDELPDSIFVEWQKWVSRLEETENVKVPRCYEYYIHLATDVQLHTLVDASEEATSSVSFLRIQKGEVVTLAFVFGKAKVAPTKKLTIPRLELTAAVMGACQADNITQELRVSIGERYFWSDSRTVLKWIRSETRQHKEFVANGVSRIRTLTSPAEWKWVSTDLNVADQGTRLKSPVNLSPESPWLRVPAYGLQEPEMWPVEDQSIEVPDDDSEIRTNINITQHLGDSLGISVSTDETCGLSGGENVAVVDITRFSDYVRMVRAQARVIKAARYWLAKIRKRVISRPWTLSSATGFQSYVSPESENGRAQWRRARIFLDRFWNRWKKEVLPGLARREKWWHDAEPLEVGDVVLLVENNAPRNTWAKGIITETFPGGDGQVRVVKVETVDTKTGRTPVYKRGVENIIPLGLKMGKSVPNPDFGGRNVVA